MLDVTVTSDDARRLARAISTHANKSALRRELYRGLNRASKPVREGMKAAIPDALPQSGGLAARMQSMVSSTTSMRGGGSAGVSIRFRSRGYDMRTLTSGRLRHPVFGNPVWVDQTAGVNPEAFESEFFEQQPQVKREVERVMADIARRVTNI